MAHNIKLSDTAADAQADALAALADGGFIRIYSGTQPANANTPLGGQTLLAELQFGSPAFGSSVGGVITANPISPETDAPATGTAAWYRVLKADGSTVLWDGSAGTSNADLVMATTSIVQHAQVSISSFTHKVQP